ncbi:MAG: hypothetical protein ABI141_09505 [Gemmatimonadaceae bacterium]
MTWVHRVRSHDLVRLVWIVIRLLLVFWLGRDASAFYYQGF